MNPDIFQQLLLAAALAVVSILGFALRSVVQVGITYLQSKIGQTNYARLRDFAGTAVKAFEQSPIYKDLTGEKKKELVKLAVLQFAEAHNLPIDEALFDKFIEAAVQEMNAQSVQIDWAGELTAETAK